MKKQKKDVTPEVALDAEVNNEEVVETKKVEEKPAKKADNKKAVKKEKKESIFKKTGKKCKEVSSELKKVTWPSFGTVVQKTGVVLAVVIFFLLVLLGIDKVLELLFGLLIPPTTPTV